MPNRFNFYLRVALSLGFLVGFYVLMVTTSLVLFVTPVFVVVQARSFGMWTFFLFALCWIPAVLWLLGLFDVRPPKFTPPGLPLERAAAPRLFALLDDLAAVARTAPPTEIYLAPSPTLAVTETGGTLGLGAKRVLILGLPLLDAITVQELRAGLGHELGHFAGGDTRLGGVLSYTLATFSSVVSKVQRGASREGTSHGAIELGFAAAKVFGELMTRAYASLFLRVMRASSRRQELAADVLAATLAGRAATMRLLEKVSLLGPTYDLYLIGDVGFAVTAGAMPIDLLDGYRQFRAAFDALPSGIRLAEERRVAKTDPFDAHPAVPVRLAQLGALPEGPAEDDARPASSLLEDAALAHAWLIDATMAIFAPRAPLRRVRWEEIPPDVYAPRTRARANEVAALFFPHFPACATLAAMFAAVAGAFERGEVDRILSILAPAAATAHPAERAQASKQLGALVLAPLFEGALLELGGSVGASFGAPSLVIRFEGEDVPAGKIAADAMHHDGARVLVNRWANRLSRAGAPNR